MSTLSEGLGDTAAEEPGEHPAIARTAATTTRGSRLMKTVSSFADRRRVFETVA